ncbi:ML domain-containing protein [Streptomyces sp. NPDC006197]|uniref:ML domain-containing protein n=1 Tax=Streptomyces sp. NPDC006197 TaxID=3156685 RepID=UPI0033BCA51E
MTSWTYVNQGDPTDALQIESVTVTPDPPERGAQAKLTVKGTAQTAIEDGAYFDVTVKLGLIKLLQKQVNLFEELRNGSASEGWSATPDPAGGPIKPGPVELTYVMQLSRDMPPAKYKVTCQAYTVDDDVLATLDFAFDFLSKS